MEGRVYGTAALSPSSPRRRSLDVNESKRERRRPRDRAVEGLSERKAEALRDEGGGSLRKREGEAGGRQGPLERHTSVGRKKPVRQGKSQEAPERPGRDRGEGAFPEGPACGEQPQGPHREKVTEASKGWGSAGAGESLSLPPSLTPMERPPDCRSQGRLGVKMELTCGLWCVTRGGRFLAPGRHWDFPLCDKHPRTPGEGLPPFWAGNAASACPALYRWGSSPSSPQTGSCHTPTPVHQLWAREVQAQAQKSRSEGGREGTSDEPPRGPGKGPGHPVEGDVIPGLEKQTRSIWKPGGTGGGHKEGRDQWAKAPKRAIAGGESANCNLSLTLCKRVGWSDCGKP